MSSKPLKKRKLQGTLPAEQSGAARCPLSTAPAAEQSCPLSTVHTDNQAAALLNKGIWNCHLSEYLSGGRDDAAGYSESSDDEDDDDEEQYLIPEPKQPDYHVRPVDDEDMPVCESSLQEIVSAVEIAVQPLLVDTDADKELQKIRDYDCRCYEARKENSALQKVSCIKKLSISDVYQMRLDYAALSPECRDIAIMAIYAALTNDSAETQRSKKVNTERKHCRTNYTIKATVVCRATFCFCFG